MGKLIDSYNEIISHVKSINDRIRQIESEIQQKSADTASDKTARIIKLEEQLVKIDDYILRVRGFQELAKRTGYTEYYFSHKFKKELGCSVNEYILNVKIEQAKLLLAGTTDSIQSISDNLAFSNRSYFYTCFQKVTGMSPTEFRKQHHN